MPADALDVARVHVRTWQAAYRGLVADEVLEAMRPEERAARYDFTAADPARPFTVVAIEEGVVRGFATTAPASDPDAPGHGELCALHVDPDSWSQGFGAALVASARERLAELGFRDALLWMAVGNVRADRFYRSDGWLPDGARKPHLAWGVTLDLVRYRRSLTK